MRIRFQYLDHSEWEGAPEEAHLSPDCDRDCPGSPDAYHPKGVIRMYVITYDAREQAFVYDDFYYLYPEAGGWVVGSGTPKRDFFYSLELPWGRAREIPVVLPVNAVVRKGRTVSQEEAVQFGLIKSVDRKQLHPKAEVKIDRRG